MTIGITRRRLTITLVALALVTGAGTAALQAGKRNAARAADGPAVALQFAPADLTYVERTPLARWLPVCGTLQPVHQAIVEAKVAGDIAGLGILDGEAVRAGQRIARVESADLASRLVDRVGVVESAQAQLALAEKMRAMTCGS